MAEVPREVVELVELLGRPAEWSRISRGNDLAWEADGVVVSLELDEEETGVEIWTVEVERDDERPDPSV